MAAEELHNIKIAMVGVVEAFQAHAETARLAGVDRPQIVMGVGNYLKAIQPKKPKHKGWQRPYKYHK